MPLDSFAFVSPPSQPLARIDCLPPSPPPTFVIFPTPAKPLPGGVPPPSLIVSFLSRSPCPCSERVRLIQILPTGRRIFPHDRLSRLVCPFFFLVVCFSRVFPFTPFHYHCFISSQGTGVVRWTCDFPFYGRPHRQFSGHTTPPPNWQ